MNSSSVEIDGAYEMMLPSIAWLEKQGKNNMGISEATKQKLKDNLHKALEKETPESWNEFLERQGEQKPVDKVEPKFKVGDIIRHKEQGFTCKIIAVDTEYRLSECNGTHLPFDSQDAYEIVEQKPVWSEEDEEMFKSLKTLLNDASCYSCTEGVDKILSWLKPIKDRVQPQPKKEWSKEDKKIANSIWDSIDKSVLANYGVDEDKAFEWLSHIKNRVLPQPKQEWSEEDEKRLRGLICLLDDISQDKRWDFRIISENERDIIENWLKCLKDRYTWKPSEEQIIAINTAINVLGKGTLNGKQLIELQEQLKKLREE